MKIVQVWRCWTVVAALLFLFGAPSATGQRPGEGGKGANKGDLAVQSLELVPLSSAVAVRVTVRNVSYDDAMWAAKPPAIRVACVSPETETVTRIGRVRPIRPNGTEQLFFTKTMPSNPMSIVDVPSIEELAAGSSPPEKAGILTQWLAWQCTAELMSPDDDSSNNRAKGGQAASYDVRIALLEFVNSGSSPPTAIVKATVEGRSAARKVQLQCTKSGEPARTEEKEIVAIAGDSVLSESKGIATFGKPGAGFVPSAAGWQCTARITGGKGPDKNPANDVFTAPVP